jgi:hypothetical protein
MTFAREVNGVVTIQRVLQRSSTSAASSTSTTTAETAAPKTVPAKRVPGDTLPGVVLLVGNEAYRAALALAIAASAQSAADPPDASAEFDDLLQAIAELLVVQIPPANSLDRDTVLVVSVAEQDLEPAAPIAWPGPASIDAAPQPTAGEAIDARFFRAHELQQIEAINLRRSQTAADQSQQRAERWANEQAWLAERGQQRAELRERVAQVQRRSEVRTDLFATQAQGEHQAGLAAAAARIAAWEGQERVRQAEFGQRLDVTVANAAERAKQIVAWIAGGANAAGAAAVADAAQEATALDGPSSAEIATPGEYSRPSPPPGLNLGSAQLEMPAPPISSSPGPKNRPGSSTAANRTAHSTRAREQRSAQATLAQQSPSAKSRSANPGAEAAGDDDVALGEQMEARLEASLAAEWERDRLSPIAVYGEHGFVRRVGDQLWWFEGDDFVSEHPAYRRKDQEFGPWEELRDNENEPDGRPTLKIYPLTDVALAKFNGRYWRKPAGSNAFEEIDRLNYSWIRDRQSEFERDPAAFRRTFGLFSATMKGAEVYLGVWAELSRVVNAAKIVAEALHDDSPAGEEKTLSPESFRPPPMLRGPNLPSGQPPGPGAIRGPGSPGGDFVIQNPTPPPRRVRARPRTSADTKGNWGLRTVHMDKHFFGESHYALKQIDPGGNPDRWSQNVAILYSMPETVRRPDGIVEVFGRFPRSDGSGFYTMGVRLHERSDGAYDLVTVLTRQGD